MTKRNRITLRAIPLRLILGAALLAPITAGIGFEPVSAAPQGPLIVIGSVAGPGFSPTARTWVFATINDEQDHHDSAPLERPALSPSMYTTSSGNFALAIPPSATLDAYAAKHLGWANLFVYAVSSNGAAAWTGVPVKQTAQGFVVTHIEKTFANTLSIKLPAVSSNQGSSAVIGHAPPPPPPCGGPESTGDCLPYLGPPPMCWATNYQINPPIPVDTVVAELHSWQTSDMRTRAKITYYNQASSEVDLGYSADGQSWSFSGEETFNTDKKSSAYAEVGQVVSGPSTPESFEFAPTVTYFKYQDVVHCDQMYPQPTQQYDAGFQVAPNSCCSGVGAGLDLGALDGETQYDKHCYSPVPGQDPPYCFGYLAPSGATKETSTTDRYTFAAKVLGFNVGVTSDWGNGLAIDYQFDPCSQPQPTCSPYRKRYWFWGGHQEPDFDSASTLYAYMWPDDTQAPTPSPGVPDHVCYGGVCPI